MDKSIIGGVSGVRVVQFGRGKKRNPLIKNVLFFIIIIILFYLFIINNNVQHISNHHDNNELFNIVNDAVQYKIGRKG